MRPVCPCVCRGHLLLACTGGLGAPEWADLARPAVGGRLPEPVAAVVPVVGVHVQQVDVGQSPTAQLGRAEVARGPFFSSHQFFMAKMPARPRPSSAALKLPRTQALIRRQPAASGPRAEPHAQTAGGPSPSRRNPPASRAHQVRGAGRHVSAAPRRGEGRSKQRPSPRRSLSKSRRCCCGAKPQQSRPD